MMYLMVSGIIVVYGADSGECGDNSGETGEGWGYGWRSIATREKFVDAILNKDNESSRLQATG